MGGLAMSAVTRLKKTWSYLSRKFVKTKDDFDRLSDMVSPKQQYAVYRKTLKSFVGPCIPFLGVFLTDLTFIEIGNSDYLSGTHYINFSKRFMVYNLIKDIQNYQNRTYKIDKKEAVYDFLASLENQKLMNEDELYGMSLSFEPRESS